MALDVTNIIAGPADFQLADTQIGHTQGGIVATVTPNNRVRVVDFYGTATVAIVHMGDEVRMTVPFAEWAAASLGEIYNPGNDQTAAASGEKYMGIGRKPGYLYSSQDAKIIPLITADVQKRVQFFAVTPIGELVLNFNTEQDRVSPMEFACMVDESQADGELIGKLNLTTS